MMSLKHIIINNLLQKFQHFISAQQQLKKTQNNKYQTIIKHKIRTRKYNINPIFKRLTIKYYYYYCQLINRIFTKITININLKKLIYTKDIIIYLFLIIIIFIILIISSCSIFILIIIFIFLIFWNSIHCICFITLIIIFFLLIIISTSIHLI